MKWSNTSTQWGAISQLFHWGILLLIITQYILAYTMLELPPSDQTGNLFAWHKQIGVTILFLVCLRLWWRLHNPIPKDSPKEPRWAHSLAQTNIWVLYILLFSFPLTGFLLSTLNGHGVSYFGLFTIPAFTEGPTPYGKIFLKAHIWISYSVYFFVPTHILGGLYHHFILKDNVLIRMLPLNPRNDEPH
jgi:cytochrome b561